jgi:hypothetical protein
VTIADITMAGGWAFTVARIAKERRHGIALRGTWIDLAGAAAYGMAVPLAALVRDWAAAGGDAGLAVFWLWLWWRGRRGKRRRALKAIGDKTRAVLAAMAGNMPRAAPRPAPQSA